MSDDDKELEIRMSEFVRKDIEEHPERAEQVRELMARLRQALEGVDWEDQDSVMAAMQSIGIERVRDPDEMARLDQIAAAEDSGGAVKLRRRSRDKFLEVKPKRPSTARQRPSALPRSLDELPEQLTEKPMQEPEDEDITPDEVQRLGYALAGKIIDMCIASDEHPKTVGFAFAGAMASFMCAISKDQDTRLELFDAWAKMTRGKIVGSPIDPREQTH